MKRTEDPKLALYGTGEPRGGFSRKMERCEIKIRNILFFPVSALREYRPREFFQCHSEKKWRENNIGFFNESRSSGDERNSSRKTQNENNEY